MPPNGIGCGTVSSGHHRRCILSEGAVVSLGFSFELVSEMRIWFVAMRKEGKGEQWVYIMSLDRPLGVCHYRRLLFWQDEALRERTAPWGIAFLSLCMCSGVLPSARRFRLAIGQGMVNTEFDCKREPRSYSSHWFAMSRPDVRC